MYASCQIQFVFLASSDVRSLSLLDKAPPPLVCAQVSDKIKKKRAMVRACIARMSDESHALCSKFLVAMLNEGSTAFHHHTVEHQQVNFADQPEKGLGAACNLNDERKRKRRAGRALQHDQERMFGVLRHKHDRASTLLHINMEGRVRAVIDRPDVWMLQLVAEGSMSEATLNATGRAVAVEARRRAHEVGGRNGQALRLGRVRMKLDEELLQKAAEKQRKVDAELARLAALRVDRVSLLRGMSSAELLDQIRAFKLIDQVSCSVPTYMLGFEMNCLRLLCFVIQIGACALR